MLVIIVDLEELKRLSDYGKTGKLFRCFINLAGIRSSKLMSYYSEDNNFYIFHEIDGSSGYYDEEGLLESNVGKALLYGKLCYEYI